MITAIGRRVVDIVMEVLDLCALLAVSVRASFGVMQRSRRTIFFRLFRRQLYFAGVQAMYVSGAIAVLVGALLVSKLQDLAQGQSFSDVYGHLFVIIVVRELSPLICGVILIARSASAITAEVGFLKVGREFEVLRGLGIDPVFVLLVPVFFAFPLSLLLMLIYFDFVSVLAGYAMIWLLEPTHGFFEFLTGILAEVTIIEAVITALKGIIGGLFIGVVSIYFGSKVHSKFTDVSRAIANATTSQLIIFFLINVLLSVLAYGA